MPKGTRSGSQDRVMSVEDVKALLGESEARVMAKLDSIITCISSLESRLDKIQTQQANLSLEVTHINDVIVKQQEQLERLEFENRKSNLIYSGIPEANVEIDDDVLQKDTEKIEYLCNNFVDSDHDISIIACTRLGKPRNGGGGTARLLHVKFSSETMIKDVLSSQRKARESEGCKKAFGRVYINRDCSSLVRKEEKRLRDKVKHLRMSAGPNDRVYLRSGKLFFNTEVIDQVSVANQLR